MSKEKEVKKQAVFTGIPSNAEITFSTDSNKKSDKSKEK